MRYAKIRKYDVSNGAGIRTTIFVSGCTHNCPNCFNKEAQSFSHGEKWTKDKEAEFLHFLQMDKRIVGVNILGGEPLQQGSDMLRLVSLVKQRTNLNIWLWTGYTWEELMEMKKSDYNIKQILRQIDILIDGRFVEAKKDLRLKYRGSSNQRVIDVQKSLETGSIIALADVMMK